MRKQRRALTNIEMSDRTLAWVSYAIAALIIAAVVFVAKVEGWNVLYALVGLCVVFGAFHIGFWAASSEEGD